MLGVRELLAAWIANLPIIIWYEISDDGNSAINREHNFGLYTSHAAKPAGAAISYLISTAGMRDLVGINSDSSSKVYAIKLRDKVDSISIIWNTDPERTYQLDLPSNHVGSVRDMFGNAITTTHTGHIVSTTLSENAGPIYVAWR